jgi:5'-nucleotidase
MLRTLIVVMFSVFITNCGLLQRRAEDSISGGRISELEPQDAQQEHIVLFGTNDIHGTILPVPHKSREPEGQPSVSYTRGGLAVMAGHIRLLRNRYGNRLLLLDAGDEFQGSIESTMEEGAPMVQYFNAIGLHAAAIGNHEFDFGPVGPSPVIKNSTEDPRGALRARMQEAQYPYVAANFIDESTGRAPDLPNLFSHRIFQAGRVKVGVLGLMTTDTPTTTRSENFLGYRITDLATAARSAAKALRSQGAQVVVLTAHAGLFCEYDTLEIRHELRAPPRGGGPAASSECRENSEIVRMIRALQPGTLDAVVSGHSHSVVHHWVNGVPVIQGGSRGEFYNLIHLTYDMKAGKVISSQSRIEGPIPVCEKVFAKQGDCNGDKPAPAAGRGSLVAPTLYGETVEPDYEIANLLAPTLARTEQEKRKVLAEAALPIDHTRVAESALGNLVSDAIREEVGADVALVNPGGIRANIDAGPVTYEQIFRSFPFDNHVSMLEVSGKELKQILRVAQNGAKGYFPISGAQLKVIKIGEEASSDDLNKDGKIQPWEVNRLLEARLANGEKIKDEKRYKLATLDFLVTGGDDMGWVMSRVPKERVHLTAGGYVRDVLQIYLGKLGRINTPENPLVNPQKPRLILEKTPAEGGRRRRRR